MSWGSDAYISQACAGGAKCDTDSAIHMVVSTRRASPGNALLNSEKVIAAFSYSPRIKYTRPSQKMESASRAWPLLNLRNSLNANCAVSRSFCSARPRAKRYCSSGLTAGNTSGCAGTSGAPSVSADFSVVLSCGAASGCPAGTAATMLASAGIGADVSIVALSDATTARASFNAPSSTDQLEIPVSTSRDICTAAASPAPMVSC